MIETYTDAKPYLVAYLEQVTAKDPRAGRNMYACPFTDCRSGQQPGRGHNGALSVYKDGTKWKCHACGRGGDVIDLVKELENDTAPQALKRLASIFGGYRPEQLI